MVKPHKVQPVSKPVPPVSVEPLGVINYFADFEKSGVANESLNQPVSGNPSPTPVSNDSPPVETTIIDRKNGVYHVYFHTGDLTTHWWGTNLCSFTEWLMSLTKDDVIHIHQTGRTFFMPGIIQGLQALDSLCRAKKVFIVDHMIETPLYMLVCDDIVIEDMGAVIFSNCIPEDVRRNEKILRPYLQRLYARAVDAGMLSESEVESIIEDNAIIFKTARELRPQ